MAEPATSSRPPCRTIPSTTLHPSRPPVRETAERRWLQPARAIGLPALAGLVVWLAVAAINLATTTLRLTLIDLLLLFAQLVIVPVGMPLMRPRTTLSRSLMLLAWWIHRFAAFGLVLSVLIPVGPVSAAAAAPWLVFAACIGLAGLASFAAPAGISLPSLGRLGAGGAVAVAAVVYLLYRGGVSFAGFGDTIVELTAVHYNATGFGGLLVAGALLDATRGRWHRLAQAALWLLVTGLVFTPIGFLTHSVLQLVGAICVATGVATVASVTGGLVVQGHVPRSARPWLGVSAASALAVAVLAAIYAVTEAAGGPAIPILTMAATHGVLALAGFLGCGLVGWRLA